MNSTSLSLLQRLQKGGADSPAWRELEGIYMPLVRCWLQRIPGLGQDVDDLAQEVLLVVFREMPDFQRQRDGSFRAWLRQIALNRMRAWLKKRQHRPAGAGGAGAEDLMAQLQDPASDLSQLWNQDHDQHVVKKLLALVRPDFSTQTWEAFEQFALAGLPAGQVAEKLGISEGAVVQAKFRILKRLREEAGDLLD